MAEQDLNYMQDLKIDQYNLDLEWVNQAHLMMKYSEASAQAVFDRDKLKQARDLIEAKLDRIARSSPAPAELPTSAKTGEATAPAILNWIHNQPEYIEAQQKRIEAEYRVNLYQQAIFAFQARKSALENLVKLHLGKYYSETYVPPDMAQSALEKGRAGQEDGLNAAMDGTSAPEIISTVPPRPNTLRAPLKRP